MSDFPLSPFVLGEADNLAALPDYIDDQIIIKIPIGSPDVKLPSKVIETWRAHGFTCAERISATRFARLLNLANGVAYGGGMGMPEWVMLDCALLPSFFAGFMGPSDLLSTHHKDLIGEGLETVEREMGAQRAQVEGTLGIYQGTLRAEEWFPISEFCAIPRLAPREVVGYSLYSLRRGYGGRAKAFGLWLLHTLGYRRQVGVAQWTNQSAVRAHLRFGPLELIDPLTPSHTKAGETFIYRLTLPSVESLVVKALGTTTGSHQRDLSESGSLEWRRVQDLSWWLTQRSAIESRLSIFALRGKGDEQMVLVGPHEQNG